MKRFSAAWLFIFSPTLFANQDLLDSYDLALQSDPQLYAQAADRQATAELAEQADALFLPNIGLTANVNKIFTDNSSQQFSGKFDSLDRGYTLSLIQPVYRRENFVQNRQADIAIDGAEARYQVVSQALIVRVAEAYFTVLAAEDDLQFAEAEREAINEQLDEAEKRFEVGLATITDVTEAQAAYDLANAAVITAKNALANSQELLRETTGRYPDDLATLTAEVPLVRPEPEDIQQWRDSALVTNPSLLVVGADVELARENIELQRSGHYPALDFIAQKSYQSQSDSNISGQTQSHQEILGLQFTLPIYAGGSVLSRTREAGHRLDQTMQFEEQQRRAVLRQTSEAYNSVLSGISGVQALAQAVRSNEKALQATEAGFTVGTRTTVDVLNARRELFSARRDFAQARYSYIVDTLRLKQAAGIVTVTDLQQVNAWLNAGR
ncbi:Type I secretion outer membrane protein, TolC precursor [Methylophaga frappieri]|uniref:Type I secretion outer membrane protein, TolC n=1 Tax=Methylophaga frappieri (strain ATCC BAA-2434 / DSM 25690 / JAM7) TaxID=754477 RepID=I1YI04_METFJ|nr:TolC family outer membrane protein [Methylophaga frappieri]AFJ02547.1 Type I secretion outer membrane protein, TolC precursor [Methylophaga frappieri]